MHESTHNGEYCTYREDIVEVCYDIVGVMEDDV